MRPPVEEGFKANKVVTAENRKKLLAYVVSEKHRGPLFFVEGAVACQFSFPTEVEKLGLDDVTWESIREVIRQPAHLRNVQSISEFASSAKLLFPEKAQLICTPKIFSQVKAEVELELELLTQEATGRTQSNILSVAFGAMVLFPDRLAELGLKSEVVLDLLASKVPTMDLEANPGELFKMRMVFPNAVSDLDVKQIIAVNQQRIMDDTPENKLGISRFLDEQYLKDLLGLQLLADDARIDSNGLIVIPPKVQLREAPQLPNRPAF